MAGMAAGHRAAAGLADIAEVEPAPAGKAGREARQVLQEAEHHRLAIEAVPAQPHHLPGRAGFGHRLQPGRAAARIAADRRGLLMRRGAGGAEQLPGQRFGRGCGRKQAQRKGCDKRFHGVGSPVAAGEAAPDDFTQGSSTRPRRKSTMIGTIPIAWVPVICVVTAISSGARKAVALPVRA